MSLKQLQKDAQDAQMDFRDYLLFLLVNGGASGVTNLTDILNALQTYGNGYFVFGETYLTISPVTFDTLRKLIGGTFYNPNNYPVFIKFYAEAEPTVGDSFPVYQIMIPALGQVILDATTVYQNVASVAVTKLYEYTDITPVTLPIISYFKLQTIA